MVSHFGGIILPAGHTDPVVLATGNPYGTSHVLGLGNAPVSEEALHSARAQANRVVHVARALKQAR